MMHTLNCYVLASLGLACVGVIAVIADGVSSGATFGVMIGDESIVIGVVVGAILGGLMGGTMARFTVAPDVLFRVVCIATTTTAIIIGVGVRFTKPSGMIELPFVAAGLHAAIIAAAGSLWPYWRWRRGRCPKCGYDFRGHRVDAKCPECGDGTNTGVL